MRRGRRRNFFYGPGIDIKWDYDEILWKQVDRTLEAINTGDRFFLNHVEALVRLINISSFVGNPNENDGSYDAYSRKYEERMKRIERETVEELKKRPKEQQSILFDAGLRKLNTIMTLLDDRKITPQRQEHAII